MKRAFELKMDIQRFSVAALDDEKINMPLIEGKFGELPLRTLQARIVYDDDQDPKKMGPPKIGDFLTLTVYGVCISQRAYVDMIQALKITHYRYAVRVNERDYVLVIPATSYKCFDFENSKYKLFPHSTRIMMVDKFAFLENAMGDEDLFTVAELDADFFVSERFLEWYARAGATGAKLLEVATR